MSLWRNGLARWTSNPEVPGSSPGRDVCLHLGMFSKKIYICRFRKSVCFFSQHFLYMHFGIRLVKAVANKKMCWTTICKHTQSKHYVYVEQKDIWNRILIKHWLWLWARRQSPTYKLFNTLLLANLFAFQQLKMYAAHCFELLLVSWQCSCRVL